jgi:competence protein CoiA
LLTAITSKAERICLGDGWNKDHLVSLRENAILYCPNCHERVTLKLGEKRIFHFAHQKGSFCSVEHEGETDFHLKGKLQLYQWLKLQNLNPTLEFYDASIKQRADMIFTIATNRYALEFQCSTISDTVFNKRTMGYRSRGYIPLWILGANQLKTKNSFVSSLSDFHFLFLQKTPFNTWTIPFYCSETQNFILLHSIQPLTIRKFISNKTIQKLNQIPFTHLFSLPIENKTYPSYKWIGELEQLKNSLIRYSTGHQKSFLLDLYQNHLNVLLLPPFIGLPVQESISIITPPLIWQAYLFLDVFFKKDTQTPISYHEIYNAFTKRKMKNHIHLRQSPVDDELNPSIAVYQYIELLVKLGILLKFNETTFLINHPIILAGNIEEQKENEKQFFKKYSHIIFFK